MINENLVSRYANLFKGNSRSYGVWVPDTTKMMTEKKSVTDSQYSDHLNGVMGLGLVPIMDNSMCWFGAIDIDNHGEVEDTDLAAVTKIIRTKKLPLVACRSKSGGVHAYVFCKEPVRAKLLKTAMVKWAADLGFPKAEIFPKQDALEIDIDGERRLGNWINLCYFDADDTVRYSLGKKSAKATLEEFITEAESLKVSSNDLTYTAESAHAEAPPCLQRLYAEGVPEGTRNDALYNIVIYRKRSNPNTYADDVLDDNNEIFKPPLPTSEAKKIIKSASRRDYKYKCQLEPLKSRCDSATCVTREYGIPKNDYDEMEAESSLPVFEGLLKYLTDPVKWGILVTVPNDPEKKRMLVSNIPTEVLYNFDNLKNKITEVLSIGVPSITKRNWERKIIPLINKAESVELPEDASVSGVISNRLKEFLDKADVNGSSGDIKEREKLLRGIPCVTNVKSERRNSDGTTTDSYEKCVVFRGMDFVRYLKMVKSEDVKGSNLWFALTNQLGLTHQKISVLGKKMTVWCIPYSSYERPEHPSPNVTPEF